MRKRNLKCGPGIQTVEIRWQDKPTWMKMKKKKTKTKKNTQPKQVHGYILQVSVSLSANTCLQTRGNLQKGGLNFVLLVTHNCGLQCVQAPWPVLKDSCSHLPLVACRIANVHSIKTNSTSIFPKHLLCAHCGAACHGTEHLVHLGSPPQSLVVHMAHGKCDWCFAKLSWTDSIVQVKFKFSYKWNRTHHWANGLYHCFSECLWWKTMILLSICGHFGKIQNHRTGCHGNAKLL